VFQLVCHRVRAGARQLIYYTVPLYAILSHTLQYNAQCNYNVIMPLFFWPSGKAVLTAAVVKDPLTARLRTRVYFRKGGQVCSHGQVGFTIGWLPALDYMIHSSVG
jgi:hypothetical protein